MSISLVCLFLTSVAFGLMSTTIWCSSFTLNVERRNSIQIKDPSRAESLHRPPKSPWSACEDLRQTVRLLPCHTCSGRHSSGRTSRIFSLKYFTWHRRAGEWSHVISLIPGLCWGALVSQVNSAGAWLPNTESSHLSDSMWSASWGWFALSTLPFDDLMSLPSWVFCGLLDLTPS